MPRISAVIPAFNSASYLASAIESVLVQTVPVGEIIVVDDGSTDDTQHVLRQFGGSVVVAVQENAGAAAARNKGVSLASGDWIAFLDADDIWFPGKTERQLEVISRFPELVLTYGPMRDVRGPNEDLAVWPDKICESPADPSLLPCWAALEQMPPTSTVVMRRELLLQVGGFGVDLKTAEDLDLWVRLRGFGPFVGVPEVLAYRRLRPGSLTHSNDASSQYPRYLKVAARRRRDIEQWAPGEYWRARRVIHTAVATSSSREGRRGRQLTHAAKALAGPHRDRRLALALFLEAMVGSSAYGWARTTYIRWAIGCRS